MTQKKVAVMQPYLFPYIGYFQLIQATEAFVFYDDVTFINRGWINRNRILVNKRDSLLSVPLIKASQNKLINEVGICYGKEYNKLLKKIEYAYKKAPYFDRFYEVLESVFSIRYNSIAELAINSIQETMNYLEIKKKFYCSSKVFNNSNKMEKADRLIHITKKLDSINYVNPIGGAEIYDKEYFMKDGVRLHFIKNTLTPYKQFGVEFIPGLSIIDVLMFNPPNKVRSMLNDYKLV